MFTPNRLPQLRGCSMGNLPRLQSATPVSTPISQAPHNEGCKSKKSSHYCKNNARLKLVTCKNIWYVVSSDSKEYMVCCFLLIQKNIWYVVSSDSKEYMVCCFF